MCSSLSGRQFEVEELSFEQIQKRLTEQFLREERGVETDEELGNAVLDLILQSCPSSGHLAQIAA